jgi:hypothetical protein
MRDFRVSITPGAPTQLQCRSGLVTRMQGFHALPRNDPEDSPLSWFVKSGHCSAGRRRVQHGKPRQEAMLELSNTTGGSVAPSDRFYMSERSLHKNACSLLLLRGWNLYYNVYML